MNKIYFITGVCGAGKTTVIKHLKSILNKDIYHVHDFDERGVPDNADRKWRLKETEHWKNLGKINTESNISTIVCGFVNPEEIKEENIVLILLDADEKTIEGRIRSRYKNNKDRVEDLKRASGMNVEQFIKDNTSFLKIIREVCQKDKRCNILDTINRNPDEVAKNIIKVFMCKD